MDAKGFFKPVSWLWRCWPCSLALLAFIFIFDYALDRFTGLGTNREVAEKILYQDAAIRKQLGEIQSFHERKRISYEGVPGKEPKYLEYRYAVKGKLDTATVHIRLFLEQDGSISHHSVEIGQ